MKKTIFYTTTYLSIIFTLLVSTTYALNGGTLRLNTYNGWKAFEIISEGDNPSGDGFNYALPGVFDGAGAWLVDPLTLRVQLNHEQSDGSISEVNLNLENFQTAINNMIVTASTGGVHFVNSARQAYHRWSNNGGLTWTNTSNTTNTSFTRFCSGQAYAPNTFGTDRGFVDDIYITGEEFGNDRLFAIDSVNRDFYQLSGVTGSAAGGIGGMDFDSFENAALIDTKEDGHVALLLSPDGGSSSMKLYIGEKGKAINGSDGSSFLARNGLAYGSWYYLNASYPSLNNTNSGSFDTSSSGALTSSKLEDVDTSPSDPTQVVLGDQNSGLFTFSFHLNFGGVGGHFSSAASSFTITKIQNHINDSNGNFGDADNVDWTDATNLAGNTYADGLIFVNEDTGTQTGEIWMMMPDGSNLERIADTKSGGPTESSGIFDVSIMVGYTPGSIMITNNQGSSSMSVLINPEATVNSSCYDFTHFSEIASTWLTHGIDPEYIWYYNFDNTGQSENKIDEADLLNFIDHWLCF